MNPLMSSENEQEKFTRVIPIKIVDVLCYPKFKCIHLVDPGQEQLKKDLYRYRFNEVLIQLFEYADNYSASDKWLHSNLFAEKTDSIRLIWEYTNMMLIHSGGESYLENYPSDNESFKQLSEFYKVNGTLPLSEEKTIISLFRKMIQMDSYVELEGFENLPMLFISPIEK